MSKKYYIITGVYSAVLTVAIAPVATFGNDVKMAVAGIFFFYLTYWRLSREGTNKGYLFLALLVPPLAFYVPMYLIYFNQMSVGIPASLFHLVGIGAAYVARSRTTVFRTNSQIHFFIICLTASTLGFDYWLHRVNFGSWTGVTKVPIPEFVFTKESGSPITRDSVQGKIVVLDFWTTTCGACFKSFPKFNETVNKLKSNPHIKLYAVNVPLKSDSVNEALTMIRSRGYSFPVLFAPQSSINTQFDFNVYPTVFVLKDRSIIYKGSLTNLLENHSGLVGL